MPILESAKAVKPPVDLYKDQYDQILKDSQYQATTNAFEESKATAGRVNDIISKDSPLMQTARTRGLQTANQRGLLNSGLAAQAGEQSVIETATPIASNDANLYLQNSLANMAAINQAARDNAAARGNTGLARVSTMEQGRQFGISDENAKRQLDLTNSGLALQRARDANDAAYKQSALDLDKSRLASSEVQAGLDRQNKVELARIEAQYRDELQSSVNISNAWGTLQTEIGRIQTDKDLTSATKKTMIDNATGQFQNFANFWSKSEKIDVSDLLNFKTEDPAAKPPVKGKNDTGVASQWSMDGISSGWGPAN